MLEHLHFQRAGETKLIIELTFSNESELSAAWDQIAQWYKAGPKETKFTLGKAKSTTFQRKKT